MYTEFNRVVSPGPTFPRLGLFYFFRNIFCITFETLPKYIRNMKRQFNIFDGLFLMALYFKITGTGLVLCWAAVFIPYYVEGALAIITAYSQLFGWADRVKYWLWKFALNRRVAKAGDKAREFMKAQEEAGKEKARQTGGKAPK